MNTRLLLITSLLATSLACTPAFGSVTPEQFLQANQAERDTTAANQITLGALLSMLALNAPVALQKISETYTAHAPARTQDTLSKAVGTLAKRFPANAGSQAAMLGLGAIAALGAWKIFQGALLMLCDTKVSLRSVGKYVLQRPNATALALASASLYKLIGMVQDARVQAACTVLSIVCMLVSADRYLTAPAKGASAPRPLETFIIRRQSTPTRQ